MKDESGELTGRVGFWVDLVRGMKWMGGCGILYYCRVWMDVRLRGSRVLERVEWRLSWLRVEIWHLL